MERLLTVRQASRMLNVHGNTMRRWSDAGLVKTYRVGVGNQRRFEEDDVRALVKEQVVQKR